VSATPEPLAAVYSAGAAHARALVCPDDGTAVSFEELAQRADALAAGLRGLGVERGARVALALGNGPEIVELLFAVTALGAAAAPLNPAYTTDELAFYLEDLAPRLLLLPEGELAAARTAAGRLDIPVADVRGGDGRTVIARAAAAAAYEPGGPEDIAILLHTSGTTSRPKQVPLLQRNLVASARSMARHYRLSAEDVSYVAMPLFHVHGLVASTLAALVAGGTVVVPRRLAPRRFWQHLREHGVTWFSAGPTIHHMLLERGEDAPGRGGTRLRFTRSCSSALSPELLARCEEVYGVPMLEAYGMTEASHEMAANPLPPGERRPGSVGVPTGAAIRIVDRAWSEVPAGEPGEVTVSGPGLTPGYLGNPEANAESFRDGWFRTGDQGVLDAGYLRLVGRIKELIIRGGENISPAEVEDVLLAHPAVSDAAVFGVPDEKYGEVVAAAVALKGETDEHALIAHCRERLTAVKVPSVIHILDAIPRTPTGKLQRRRVAAAIYGE
jgi:acyl-CoA synthetase (AMP-forming)/AMP-acid ligase II